MELRLNAYEQSALAELAAASANIKRTIFHDKVDPTAQQLERFSNIVMSFDKINWGTLYDKLHRTGANS